MITDWTIGPCHSNELVGVFRTVTHVPQEKSEEEQEVLQNIFEKVGWVDTNMLMNTAK